jgi:hypothetical protein
VGVKKRVSGFCFGSSPKNPLSLLLSLTVQQRHVQRGAAVRVAVVQVDARLAVGAGRIKLGVRAAAAAGGGGQDGGQRLHVAGFGGVVQGAEREGGVVRVGDDAGGDVRMGPRTPDFYSQRADAAVV